MLRGCVCACECAQAACFCLCPCHLVQPGAVFSIYSMSVFSYSFSSSMTPEGQRKPVTVVLGNALHFPEVVFETGNRAISKTSWCLQGKAFSLPWKHPFFHALLLMPKMVSLRLPCYARVPDGAIKDGQVVIIATFGNRIYSTRLSFLILPQ